MSKLGIDNVRQLEDLLITECFYADLLKGKLDQEQSCLIVHDTISRDVEKSQVPTIIAKLSGWWGWLSCKKCFEAVWGVVAD